MNPLLQTLLNSPLTFTDAQFQQLINSGITFTDLRACIGTIYGLNESQLRETSNANTGVLGFLNRRSTAIRQKRYFEKNANQESGKKYVRIYAEGDSWFQFPVFVKDIIDWLDEREDYLIYSDAYGGDWITNIIYEGQYVEGLKTHDPDVFLISGGGNDLVGNSRMAVMVDKQGSGIPKYTAQNPLPNGISTEESESIMLAQPYITKQFYAYLWVMKAQYTLLFNDFYAADSPHKHILSITQGYAYPHPKKGANYSLNLLQPIVNSFLKSGQWLFRPLMIKGIRDPKLQKAIVLTFIYEFNMMLIDVGSNYPNVHHIDCRNIPQSQSDWYDELHLKSYKFEEAANLFAHLINTKGRFSSPT